MALDRTVRYHVLMAKVLTKNVQIVCLANSRKLSGRCVAGKLLDGSGQWVRPVSAREHEEVSLDERRYDNGEDPLLRDVVNLCVLENRGHAYEFAYTTLRQEMNEIVKRSAAEHYRKKVNKFMKKTYPGFNPYE